jgi:nucleoside-diphosphate-sugar epimerase
MVRNLLAALEGAEGLRHVALVTGLKHYLGPFESYAKSRPVTPFREDMPRQPGPNFYYTQEDELFEAARRRGFTWSVHRAHTIIGYALGNAMNMGVTLAVYATICREAGRPFVFPGSVQQWEGLTDVTDARILARHLEWAASTEDARDQAFNIVNGDIFRWNWLWPQIAADFGIEAAPYPGHPSPLEPLLAEAGPVWAEIAAKHQLVEPDLAKLQSAWHTDMDLGREMEVVTDMTRSRLAGFCDYQPTLGSFLDLFARLRKEHIIPAS